MQHNTRSNTIYKMGLILSSRVLTALLGIIFLPLYVRFLGVESYGLVAFYATLAGGLSLLGTGLSASTNREVSRLHANFSSMQRKASLLFSVEIINWIIAFAAGILIIMCSPLIAKYWINTQEISIPVLRYSIIVMGLIFAFQLPYAVYEGALNGLGRQGTFAVINMIFAIVKSVGVILVFMYVKADIITFFLWQLLVTAGLTLTARHLAYKIIDPSGSKKYYSAKMLRQIKSFALGITGIAVVSFFIAQADKIIVSKFLLLEYVGYYSIAFLLAGVLGMIASPLQTIALPKFNALESQGRHSELKTYYYKIIKWMAVLLMPAGFAIMAFSNDILLLWTRNASLAAQTSPILQVVTLGYAFNGVASIFYLYTLAKGNTRYGFYQNLASIVVILPLLIILTKQYGALGAASCWLIYNTMMLVISLPVFHFLYIKGEYFRWVKQAFIFPFLLSAVIFLAGKWLQLQIYPTLNVFELILILFFLSLVYILLIKDLRNYIYLLIRKKFAWF